MIQQTKFVRLVESFEAQPSRLQLDDLDESSIQQAKKGAGLGVRIFSVFRKEHPLEPSTMCKSTFEDFVTSGMGRNFRFEVGIEDRYPFVGLTDEKIGPEMGLRRSFSLSHHYIVSGNTTILNQSWEPVACLLVHYKKLPNRNFLI